MKKLLIVLPLLLLAGCRKSTPLAGGEPTLPGGGVVAPRDAYSDLSALTFQITGGFAGIDETLEIKGDRMTFTRVRPAEQRTSAFSAEDREQLEAVLRRADFVKLVGEYVDKNLRDGFNETVMVELGTGDKSKTYTVANTGDKAPAAFYEVTKYLRALQTRTNATQ